MLRVWVFFFFFFFKSAGVLGFMEEFSAQTLTFENGRNWMWTKMLKVGSEAGAFFFFLTNIPPSRCLLMVFL
jgi:hypothetical protein